MKTNIDCLPCLMRQALQTAKICTDSPKIQGKVVKGVAKLISECDLGLTPPAFAGEVYEKIKSITGVEDPYAEKKAESNQIALSMISSLREEIEEKKGDEGAELAIRFAIAGNIIDYGAYQDFDFFDVLKKCRDVQLAIDHTSQLLTAIEKLPTGSEVLYLVDNCGEIVFDTLLIERLFAKRLKITVAVKEGPIINDALMADAYTAGLDRYAKIISNGTRCPGTVLTLASHEFLAHYSSADMVISKGQGNFESLSEENREIFFLLTVKCAAAAKHMLEMTDAKETILNGTGEMVVFHSPAKI